MRTIIKNFVQEYNESVYEWGHLSVFLSQVVKEFVITYKWFDNCVDLIFDELKKVNKLEDSFLTVILHLKNDFTIKSSNIDFIKLLKSEVEIEFKLISNADIYRGYFNFVGSRTKIIPLFDENVSWKANLFYEEQIDLNNDTFKYIYMDIYPKENKLYYAKDWLYWKNLDYVIQNNLHID